MPLRANINGVDVHAPLLSNLEWEALRVRTRNKQAEVRLSCCDGPGHLRTSSKGLRHFYHASSSECSWAPETEWHRGAKTEIVHACNESGWQAKTEVAGADWRADVLSCLGDARIAFEVQWSQQTAEATRERQMKYARDGIRGLWLTRKPPRELLDAPQRQLPVFELVAGSVVGTLAVRLAHRDSTVARDVPLRDFVRHLLARRIRFCNHAAPPTTLSVPVSFYEAPCPSRRCKCVSHAYYVAQGCLSKCGIELAGHDRQFETPVDKFHPKLIDAVQEFRRTDDGKHIRLGAIKCRYSHTVGKSYQSFGCIECDAIFGEHYASSNICDYENDAQTPITRFDARVPIAFVRLAACPHWCFSEVGDFCE